ncbi:MAG: hypothetical protein ACOYU2_04590 [Nitrospirota bacterium]
MPKQRHWCDEASAAHWQQEGVEMPSWEDAATLLKESGHLSEVDYPSIAQMNGEIDIS